MLQKFLFIGLGGSGGKTLRFQYQMLSRQLRSVGWTGGMPAAWQFLHIDVPIEPDGNTPDLPEQLPTRSYVGMAPRGLTYQDLDRALLQKGSAAIEHTAGWRPRPGAVTVDPQTGAGQYRAVGRTITAAAIQRVGEQIRRAVHQLEDAATNVELSEVARLVTGSAEVSTRPPQAVVVSSIAGGSGAGALLDVCDAIRSLAPWGKSTAALLYQPDVFDDIGEAGRSGVTPNALATIAEVMSAYWSDGTHADSEYALLESAGLTTSRPGQRGPRYPLLIGRRNGDIAFGSQVDVYRATARVLTAWTVDPAVQDGVHVGIFGNWNSNAEGQPDHLGLTDAKGLVPPFSSLGFASLGLGRERFARYASERLARKCVDHLLRAHWTEDVPHLRSEEEARDERATGAYQRFLEECGLRELGPQHNQIIDAIRGGEEAVARTATKRALAADIRAAIERRGEIEAAWLQNAIMTQLRDRRDGFLDREHQLEEERAREWCRAVQDQITVETARLLGQEGAPVAAAVLDLVRKELVQAVVPELNGMAVSAESYAARNDERIRSVFSGFSEKLMSENPLVDRALDEGVNSLHADAEAQLYRLCARLIADLADNAIEPLRLAIERAYRGLQAREEGGAGQTSIVQTWPQESVPQALRPAQNEVLLEPVEEYPATFTRLVTATADGAGPVGSLRTAIKEIIMGDDDDGAHGHSVTRIGDWAPSDTVLRTNSLQASAQFKIDFHPESLLDRATWWVHRSDSAIGAHIAETLRDYLAPSATADPGIVAQRLDRFRASVRSALAASRPLVAVSASMNAEVHGTAGQDAPFAEIVTPFPFPGGHEARQIVEEVFKHVPDSQRASLFDDSDRSSVDIASFMSQSKHAIVFESLMDPIRSEWAKARGNAGNGFWSWRRARPLLEFVPFPPEVLREILRGWIIASLLGRIDGNDPNNVPVGLWSAGGRLEFPFPLLGLPIENRLDLLPAVLETSVLGHALGPDALAPYRELRTLGTQDILRGDREHTRLSLSEWIRTGKVAPGLPEPSPTVAGEANAPVNDRIEVILGSLASTRDTVARIGSDRVDGTSALHVQRVWELRHELERALDSLSASVARLRSIAADSAEAPGL